VYDRVDVMEHEVVITTKDMTVVFATSGYHALIKGKSTRNSKNLLKNIPTLRKHLTARVLLEGGLIDKFVLGDRIFTIQIIPSDNQLIFYFRSHDDFQSNLVPAQDLKELEERIKLLEAIIEEAPIGLILQRKDGTIEYINKQQEENSRMNRELIVNQDAKVVFKKAFEYPGFIEFYNSLENTASNQSVTIDHYYPQFYKKDMIVKFFGRNLKKHGRTALFVEIEDELYQEKRKAEKTGEELRMSQRYLSQLLDASPNMVISVDDKQRVVSFNKTAERLLGFKASEVYNSPVNRFFPRDELAKIDLAVSAQVLWYGTTHIFRSDMTSFPIELYSTKIKDDRTGKDVATLLLAVDLEERNRLRKNLIQSQKMNFLGELVSGLAHQLSNPLVGVVSFADILLHKIDKDDEKYRHVKMIKDAGESCKEVISHLLRFSRRQEDNTHISIDIRKVLDTSIDMFSKHPKFRKVHVYTKYKEVPFILGDPVLLEQAFINMLINSAQAVGSKGIISVECTTNMDRQILVSISDNGCGIPEDDISKVFDPFFSTKNADVGTGIGLSLAYWIIQDHGGRINVESTPGKGTIFTSIIPVEG
jgi:PAS domain S-box-containing protein